MTKKKSFGTPLPAQKRTLFSRVAGFLKSCSAKKEKPKTHLAGQPLTEEKVGMDKERTPEPKRPFSSIGMKEDNGE